MSKKPNSYKFNNFDKGMLGAGVVLSGAILNPIPLGISGVAILLKYLIAKNKDANSMQLQDYQKNFFDTSRVGSFPNRPRILDGKTWTDYNCFLNLEEPNKNQLVIDRFKFAKSEHPEIQNIINKICMNNPYLVGKRIPIDREDTTLSTCIIGRTGSGKTITLEDYLLQNRRRIAYPTIFSGEFKIWNREYILDYKGTLWDKYGRFGIDFYLNVFDDRSDCWNIWKELEYHPTVVTAFLNGIVEKRVGGGDGKSKFFSGTAALTMDEMAMRTALEYKKKNVGEKYQIFIKKLEAWIEKESNPQGNESLAKTLSLCLPPLKLLCYNAFIAKRFFCLQTDFFEQKNISLFVGNTEKYKVEIEPIVAGITDAVQLILLSRPENADIDGKADLTGIFLEEAKRINLLSLSSLFTGGRGRGACIYIIIQYFDWHKEDEISLLLSSIEVFMIHKVGEKEAEKLPKIFGQVTYIEENTSTSQSSSSSSSGGSSSASSSFSRAEKKEPFLTQEIIEAIPRWHHITLIQSRQMAYLGQSDYTKLPLINGAESSIDLEDYGIFKLYKKEWEILNGIERYNYSLDEWLLISKEYESSNLQTYEEKSAFLDKYELPRMNCDVLFDEFGNRIKKRELFLLDQQKKFLEIKKKNMELENVYSGYDNDGSEDVILKLMKNKID